MIKKKNTAVFCFKYQFFVTAVPRKETIMVAMPKTSLTGKVMGKVTSMNTGLKMAFTGVLVVTSTFFIKNFGFSHI